MRIGFALICLIFFETTLNAQKGTIEGNINDEATNSPLGGVSVNLPAGAKADNSDIFGMFRIMNVNPGAYELVLSHIGYRTEIIPVDVKSNAISTVSVNMKRTNLELSEVKITGKKNSAPNTIAGVDIMLRPINTSQDILRIVPGLFIAQHAGGGKAEQIFLRGFDIDHGTDINISVDGMPVNMVSHAHGQGYADLHFLIPETVEKVNFDKGPYTTNKGNLATAGYVEFNTKDFLEKNTVKLEVGDFNTQRIVGMIRLFNKQTQNARQQFYISSEYFNSNGYFESPQHFHRLNLMGKYSARFNNNAQLTIIASTFDSRWNASGQLPDRAVRSGMTSRFGAIDDSEGGNTDRTNVNIKFANSLKNGWRMADQVYFSRYHFNLYSNFTFYLKDPANGDEINQKETRNIFGYHSTATKKWTLLNKAVETEIGIGFRYDMVNDIELSKAVKRKFAGWKQKGDIREQNTYLYISQDIQLSAKLNINAGIRYDQMSFGYKNVLLNENDFNRQHCGLFSPKLNFTFSPSPSVKLFLNSGIGFHSNDARVILNKQAGNILPKVYGTDFGVILKPSKNIIAKTAIWHLYSQQEFVYVGDAGVIEPGGRSRRIGIDMSVRAQLISWLYGDIDINLTKARTIGEAKGENYIPLAPSFTTIGGLTAKWKNFSSSFRYRFINARPANETNSVRAEGYFLADAIFNYQWKKFAFTFSAENLLNREWREAQFDTESRLQFETSPVSEIHYTPGTPRFIKAGVVVSF